MKQLRYLSFVLPLLFLAVASFAQQKIINGKVVDEATGAAIGGVSIVADKNKGGATTLPDGTYSIAVEPGASSLIFSFVGYKTQTISIKGKNSIDVYFVI